MSSLPLDVEMQLRRHGVALRALAGEIVRDPWVADDAVQDVWLSALRRPPTHHSALGAWLATALHNAVRGLYRREARRARREHTVAATREEVAEDAVAMLAREEQVQRLMAAVRALPAPSREAIWRRYFEGLSPREIAASSDTPYATVKSRLQRGLQQLRGMLEEQDKPGWRGALAVSFGLQKPTIPTSVAFTAWPGVLLMTTWMKSVTAVALLVVAGTLLWSVAGPDGAPRAADASLARVAVAAAPVENPTPPVMTTPPNERVLLTSDAPQTAPTHRDVHVREEGGQPVAGATVWFVKPGFDYAALPRAQANLYSRSTEAYLRDFGVAQITDGNGNARIPLAAASHVVIARKGILYGSKRPRDDGEVLEIVVDARHTLTVETVDALGKPVPHVTVVGQPMLAWTNAPDPMAQWTLGETNDYGLLTYVLKPPTTEARSPARIWLHAELLDGAHGQESIDARTPPPFVQLTLPTTGTVRARIQNADGTPLDRRTLQGLHAELSIVGVQPKARPRLSAFGPSGLLYVKPDADGIACFENIVLDKTLRLRFPGMIVSTKTFPGPSEGERGVTVVQTIEAQHPFVVGTLVDSDGHPIGDANFTIMCPSNPGLLLSVGDTTDAFGRFQVWLTDRCAGQRDVVLQFGMDWGNLGPAREVSVPVRGPLFGRTDIGAIAVPHAK